MKREREKERGRERKRERDIKREGGRGREVKKKDKGTKRKGEKRDGEMNMKKEKGYLVTSLLKMATKNCLLFPLCIYTLILSS